MEGRVVHSAARLRGGRRRGGGLEGENKVAVVIMGIRAYGGWGLLNRGASPWDGGGEEKATASAFHGMRWG